MSYEQRDSLEQAVDPDYTDPHHLLFGEDDGEYGRSGDPRRHRRRQRARRRRRRRAAVVLALLAVAIVVVAGWVVVRPLVDDQLAAKDYSGQGTGQVEVRVNPGDGAGTIGAALKKAGVVRTVGAFTSAAKANSKSRSIQPGVYRLHRHMSAAAALTMLLDPASRLVIKVTIPEGSTEKEVVAALAKALDAPVADVAKAADDVSALGLPTGYSTPSGGVPTSAEGFLYPDTYNFDPDISASDALQQMVSEYASTDRSLKFSATVAKLRLSPYQGLIIASMIEGEAKFPADRAKVARVILNRMAKKMPLGIDATSIYGAELAGKDPSKIDWNSPGPYNTRHSSKLPPTPIGNPGSAALTAAAHPAPGPWLYYVNGDAAGHLAFFADQDKWAAAVERCRTHHWGCD